MEREAKRAISRRLGVDRRTVEQALGADAPPRGVSPARGWRLDGYRAGIQAWPVEGPQLTAKRVGALLRENHPKLAMRERALRRYVAEAKARLFVPRPFVHRTHRPGHTPEGDFGETVIEVAERPTKVRHFVATLPASNTYIAKVYPVERLESLLGGLLSPFALFGGLTERVVLDNTSLAVREVLRGPERVENRVFHAFRGELALAVDFCARRRGWKKGSVEGGMRYERENCFRLLLKAASVEAAIQRILAIPEAGLPTRRLVDGRSCQDASAQARTSLRPLPTHLPDACRTLPRVMAKFGHLLVDGVRHSVPIEHAYRRRRLWLLHHRIEVQVEGATLCSHVRSFRRGEHVLDPRHVLRLLDRKHRQPARPPPWTFTR